MNSSFGKVVVCSWDDWIRYEDLTYMPSKYHKANYLTEKQEFGPTIQGIIIDQVQNGRHCCFILATSINNQPFRFFVVKISDTWLIPTSITTQLVTISDHGLMYNYFQDFGQMYGIEMTPNSCTKFKRDELCEVLATGWNPITLDIQLCIVRSLQTNFVTCMDIGGVRPVREVNYEYKSNNIKTDQYFECAGNCTVNNTNYEIIGAFKKDRFVLKNCDGELFTSAFSQCENVYIDTDLSEDEIEQCYKILCDNSDKYNSTEYALIRKLCANIKNNRLEIAR